MPLLDATDPSAVTAAAEALAAGEFSSPGAAIRAMSVPKPGTAAIFKPKRSHRAAYDAVYRDYRRLGDFLSSNSDS